MLSPLTLTIVILAYMAVLFVVALFGESRSRLASRISNSGYIYGLSLAVYCTSWTFYGSVGKACTSGLLFLTIYLGPTIGIILWWTVLRKLVRIKSKYRITSIADMISARYDRSQVLAALVTVIALVGIVPYVALQLKAVISTFALLCADTTSGTGQVTPAYVGPLVLSLIVLFTIVFGVRHLDPTERHPGMILALVTECVVKLIAFVAAGLFVTYFAFDGISDIFARAATNVESIYASGGFASHFSTWTTYIILAAFAIILLPRQFHVAVVENPKEGHIRTAQWLLPLYMLAINVFVIPIALAGLASGHPVSAADTFVLRLPLEAGQTALSLLVFIGGFSAATGMIMITSMTMSIMISNHLLLPLIEKVAFLNPLRKRLLGCRWFAVTAFLLAGYAFAISVGESYMLVNMGMLSFAAVLQFAPALIGGLFWRKGNRVGAMAGLIVGFCLWSYTLLLPAIIHSGWLPSSILEQGALGLSMLRPEALFGLSGLDNLTHALCWTMLGNVGCYVVGSLSYQTGNKERNRAEEFVSILSSEAYSGDEIDQQCDIDLDEKRRLIVNLLNRYFSTDRARSMCNVCLLHANLQNQERISISQLNELRRAVERRLSGSLGGPVAESAVKESGLVSVAEQRRLEELYTRMVADLGLSIEELRGRVSHYQTKEALMRKQALLLEKEVEERTKELRIQKNRAEEMANGFKLLQEVAFAANEATSVADVTRFAMEQICRHGSWTLGRFILLDRSEESAATCSEQDQYVSPNEDCGELHECLLAGESQLAQKLRNEIISGKNEAVWLVDDGEQADSADSEIQRRAIPRTAFGLPIVTNQGIVAVLEFFSSATLEKDEDLINIAGPLGGQIGRAIERSQAEAARDEMQRKLMDVSRHAGMSEVATGVLHNVGNVLNSVNVATNLMTDKMRKSRVSELKKAGEIVEEHLDDMATFVTEHPQGRHMAKYVVEIGKHLTKEQDDIIEDLNMLRKSVEHIKEIVSMQQSYARVCGVLEEVDVKSVVEDALRMRSASFGRHHIEVFRDYCDVPNIVTDRHKLVQIIVNLIGNAKHAISDHNPTGGKLSLRISPTKDSRYVRIEVNDNGIGISDENLSRVFGHGFTTRKEGHGFGLHTSALAAKEMGGILTATSDGVGTGATFILEIPVKPVDPE